MFEIWGNPWKTSLNHAITKKCVADDTSEKFRLNPPGFSWRILRSASSYIPRSSYKLKLIAWWQERRNTGTLQHGNSGTQLPLREFRPDPPGPKLKNSPGLLAARSHVVTERVLFSPNSPEPDLPNSLSHLETPHPPNETNYFFYLSSIHSHIGFTRNDPSRIC